MARCNSTWTENATNETRFEIERYEEMVGEQPSSVIGTVAPDSHQLCYSTALRGTSYILPRRSMAVRVFGGAPDTVTVQTG